MRLFYHSSCAIVVVCLLLGGGAAFAGKPRCPAGKQPLWYYHEAELDSVLGSDFSGRLFADLVAPLKDMGYCLGRFNPNDSAGWPASDGDNLLMYIFARETIVDDTLADSSGEKELFVTLTKLKDRPADGETGGAQRPLFSIRGASEDMKTIQAIFVKKLLENFRTQYICNVSVATDPPGVMVRADNGLADKAPFEWVLPVGALRIQCSADGFLPKEETISFKKPGSYHYFLQMNKRRFYHSKFIYPTVVAALSSAVSEGLTRYFFYRYSKLDENDRKTRPELFGKTFRIAQSFERLAAGSLAVSGVFFVCCFTF